MNVQELLDYVNFRLNKDQTGQTMTPDQYNLLLRTINFTFFKWKYGLPEEYQIGAPFSRQAWELTQKMTDDLSLFLVKMDGVEGSQLLLDKNGVAALPDNYMHASSLNYWWFRNRPGCATAVKPKIRPLEVMFDAQLGPVLSHPVRHPTYKYPVASFYNKKVRVWPNEIDHIEFNYLRLPRVPVYAYTITNDEPVYNAGGSVQLEWPDDNHEDIANLIMGLASDNIRSQQMKQSAELRKQQGV